MPGVPEPEDPQNPSERRLFLISPRPAFFERLSISEDHPAGEITAILTPRLPYETWFERWRFAWRAKAKHNFPDYFCELWSPPVPPESIALDFVQSLQTTESVDERFDRWWTIREQIDFVEIDETWRPEQSYS